jgi:hypothetical protein
MTGGLTDEQILDYIETIGGIPLRRSRGSMFRLDGDVLVRDKRLGVGLHIVPNERILDLVERRLLTMGRGRRNNGGPALLRQNHVQLDLFWDPQWT